MVDASAVRGLVAILIVLYPDGRSQHKIPGKEWLERRGPELGWNFVEDQESRTEPKIKDSKGELLYPLRFHRTTTMIKIVGDGGFHYRKAIVYPNVAEGQDLASSLVGLGTEALHCFRDFMPGVGLSEKTSVSLDCQGWTDLKQLEQAVQAIGADLYGGERAFRPILVKPGNGHYLTRLVGESAPGALEPTPANS